MVQSLDRETKTETKHKLEREKIRIVSPPTSAWGAVPVFLNAPFRPAAWFCKWVRCWSRSIGQNGQAFCHVKGPTAVRKKTTTVMITHRGALDNTQSAVTAAGHLCYAPVSRLCQQISTCHTQLQPLCVSAASAHNFLCTLYRTTAVASEKKKKNTL